MNYTCVVSNYKWLSNVLHCDTWINTGTEIEIVCVSVCQSVRQPVIFCLLACMSNYLSAYLPAHLSACLLACLPAFLPAWLLTYLPTHPTFLPTRNVAHTVYKQYITKKLLHNHFQYHFRSWVNPELPSSSSSSNDNSIQSHFSNDDKKKITIK